MLCLHTLSNDGFENHSSIKDCKHGKFLLSTHDIDISRHMSLYGEWAEHELQLFLQLIKPGDIVIDAGANIGAFTVPLAKVVGATGRIHAFKPQRLINQRLNANVAINDLTNVDVYYAALGNTTGEILVPHLNYNEDKNYGALSLISPLHRSLVNYRVPMLTLDSIDFTNPMSSSKSCPSFIKIDVEFMEKYVLQGGKELIARCRPIIHAENNCMTTSPGLITQFYHMQYIPYWDLQPSYNAEVFQDIIPDITNGHYNKNMICIPQERLQEGAINPINMIGFVRAELEMPYLHQYFLVEDENGNVLPLFTQYPDC